MKRILYAHLLAIQLFFMGSSAFAICQMVGGIQRDVNIEVEVTQNRPQNPSPVNINFHCTGNNPVSLYTARNDPDQFQEKLDRLLNDLDADPRVVSTSFHLYRAFISGQGKWQTDGAPIAAIDYSFGRESGQVADVSTSLPGNQLSEGYYTLNVFGYAHVGKDRGSIYTMNFSDYRKIIDIPGIPTVTYAIDFHRDPTLPEPEVCVPEYLYRVDKTNIDFGTVPTTFFEENGSKQEDINFWVRRYPDPNCDDIAIEPHVTISPPVGGDVVNTIGNKSMLTNGTTLSLIYLEDNGGEEDMNYGGAYKIGDIGGPQWVPLNADRNIRVRWSKTPGETVKSGRWNATMKYEIYFP